MIKLKPAFLAAFFWVLTFGLTSQALNTWAQERVDGPTITDPPGTSESEGVTEPEDDPWSEGDGLLSPVGDPWRAPQQERGPRGAQGSGLVFKTRVTPHWFLNDSRFWYRNDLPGGAGEFIVVDAEHGSRQPAFDHQKLAAALSKVAGGAVYKPEKLPFENIEFDPDGQSIR